MDFLNKIELRGIVGGVHIDTIGKTKCARFSLMTEDVYKSTSGMSAIDSTWFGCVAYEGENIPDVSLITKGAGLHIIGRLKVTRWVDANSRDVSIYEVICKTIEKIGE